MGGEKEAKTWSKEKVWGSPPHGRGKAALSFGPAVDVGITPAWAGKRYKFCCMRTFRRDHPRMGGEKLVDAGNSGLEGGSPPRGRGKDNGKCLAGTLAGITPAWAGKRGGTLRLACCTADHPRMGGEKRSDRLDYYFPQGSPPRRRGKADKDDVSGLDLGITPAWAGKRGFVSNMRQDCQDHPRVGGEKISMSSTVFFWQGSPPRGRGKARHLSHGLLPCG